MPQDAFTLRYLCKELNLILKGGKVNRITQPSNDVLYLTIYTGKRTEKLLLNVNPSSPRIGLAKDEEQSPLTAPNFCMLMRKHLLSAIIESIELVGFDRIVKIEFSLSGEFFDNIKKTLYVELMGRYSNIILTENGKVLGGNRGINMFDDGVRPLIVSKPYVFPPVGNKKLPTDQSLSEVFDGQSLDELSKLITSNVQGIAEITAKEIVKTYIDKGVDKVNGKDFFEHLNEFLFRSKLLPCVMKNNEQITDVFIYPYSIVNGEFLSFDNLYEAEEFYFENKEKIKNFKSKKDRLMSILNSALKKVKKRLTAIKAKEKEALSAEENRIKGELILSNIYQLKQGQKKCVLQNYYDGSEIEIELNEFLSPSKNAENYYKKYNKQKRTLSAVAVQKEIAESEQNYYQSVIDEIELCENIEELKIIENELVESGLIKEQKQNKNKAIEQKAYRNYLVDGYSLKIGRNNIENDKLIGWARANDLWLHAKEYHSSHAIIENNGTKIPEKVIKICAEICAYYSKGRDGGKIEIVYTQKRNVKKPKGAKPGFVKYDSYESIMVEPNINNQYLLDK